MRRAFGLLVLVTAIPAMASCGKKGPPLAPLRPVPEAPGSVSVVRLGPDVHLRFLVPAQNVGAHGAVDIERVEVYAVSLAAGAPAPPTRDFLTPKYLVGTLDVRPPSVPGEPPVDPATETRPAPGEPAAFVEPLTTEMLNPPAPPPPPAPVAPVTAPGAPRTAPAPPAYPTRIYAARGVTGRGRPGNPTARVTVPLVEPPAAPADVTVGFTASAFAVSWRPPLAEVGGPPVLFHVYRAEAPTVPLTPKPSAAPRVTVPGVEFGTERCFSVRSVQRIAGISVESESSVPTCVTPTDIFPPAAPVGLTGATSAGAVALIWDASPEDDLAGYLVLRGEAPGDTLQALTPEPIRETAYRDTAVTPGVRYVYVVVAVDRATPPNRSAPSPRFEVTAGQ